MNYYERHIGDYLKDTAHLSLLEHGIYTRLLDVYYTRESAIPDDQAARLIGARAKEEREALQAVLSEFFTQDGNGWIQRRCEAEILRYQGKQAKAKASADARWSAQRSQSDRNANASGDHDAPDMRTHSDGNANGMHRAPVPSLQTPDTSIPPTPKGGPCRFEEFWTAWPKSERKQDKVKCATKWKRNGLDQFVDTILADIRVKEQTTKWREGFIEAPLVYLNGRRWEDGVEANGSHPSSNDWTGSAL